VIGNQVMVIGRVMNPRWC